ncbi:class I SAM-dependent methyltransferase [Aeoliella sp. SH292]|uniref:class I SAM-dependent methyltransferase n=1 Tax=Aeoliella sp. SH292 TaxID=3454464 RepID=UPI003F972D1D
MPTTIDNSASSAARSAGVDEQQRTFEAKYHAADRDRWWFHDSRDPLVRYLRDRRLAIGTDHFLKVSGKKPAECSVLLVCGGVGGEGSYFADRGFREVTVSDFSSSALDVCQARDPRLKTQLENAEALDLDDESYDLVVVQDGLHHLPRPVLGYNEMLRVARHGVLVIEPHTGLVADLLGTQWEQEGDAINYVFRWNHELLEQATRSMILQRPCYVRGMRVWDHNVSVRKLANALGGKKLGLAASKLTYGTLGTLLPGLGNMFIGVVVKR